MKKTTKNILFFALVAIALPADAQESFVQLVQDTSNHLYRFERIEVRAYENLSDTLVTDRFPEKWLTLDELKAYQEVIIRQQIERKEDLSRLFRLAKAETDRHIGFYDALNGEGAWLALQKQKLQDMLQGGWTLLERNGEATKTPIEIKGFEFIKNANKKGTLTISDEMTVTLVGYFNFNLTFFVLSGNGSLRAERGGKVYVLKRG